MATPLNPATVTAILGPTNTGKTHYAVERMLGRQSGVIGLPLRLLDYGRRKNTAGPCPLLCLHSRSDARGKTLCFSGCR